jgi:hypothetical protein
MAVVATPTPFFGVDATTPALSEVFLTLEAG